MQETILNKELSIIYKLFKRVEYDDFEYIYRGHFSQIITRRIISLVERNIKRFIDSSSLQNRIYFLMVESMQNITRHQDKTVYKDRDESYLCIFAIKKQGDTYIITTGNVVLNTKIEKLRSKLNKVNNLSKEELKKLHRLVLSTGEISSKGGAGLGLIEMVRRSGNKLIYNFDTIDDEKSYFYLQTTVDSKALSNDADFTKNNGYDIYDNIKYTKKLNDLITDQSIFLNFNGAVNKKNILSLLSVIKGQMKNSKVSKRIYYIVLEMLQNISKHGDNMGNLADGVLGTFRIKRTHDKYTLTSGNCIKNHKVGELKQRLDQINGLKQNELDEYFNSILLFQNNTNSKKTGLGFVDIRLKTKNKLEYNLIKVHDDFSFFTLQVSVKFNE